MKGSVIRIVHNHFNEEGLAWTQATLPVKNGGLVISSAEQYHQKELDSTGVTVTTNKPLEDDWQEKSHACPMATLPLVII